MSFPSGLVIDTPALAGGLGIPLRTRASDAFTDVDGTLITAHTPSSGGTWTKNSVSTNTAAPTIDGNRVHGENAATQSIYSHSLVPASPNYDVACDVVMRSDNNLSNGGVIGRMLTNLNTFYAVRYSTGANSWQLSGILAGAATFTTLSTVQILTVDQPYRALLRMRGTTISMSVDGVLLQSIDNASLTLAGFAGFSVGGAAAAGVGVHLDNYVVSY